jgi:hypothetical protein
MPSLWVAFSRPYCARVTDSGRNTGRRATREVATAERPWTSGWGRAAAALALFAVSVLVWAGSAAASPAVVAGGNAHGATTPAGARATTASAGLSVRLRPPAKPASSSPITVPQGERAVDAQQVVSIGPSWDGSSLNASPGQRVPFALGALILIFVVVQWLIDRRDPKFVEAAARKDDDSIGFE